jgi:hypothetical protein
VTAWVLLAGAVGALTVFLLGIWLEWRRNERERRGLLRLLLAEVEHNAEVTRTVGERTWDLFSSPDFLRSMKMDTWRAARVRGAGLLPMELVAVLNEYYLPLQTLQTLKRFKKQASDRTDRGLRALAKEARLDWDVAATRNPYDEYLEKMLTAQDKAQDQIQAYLDSSWGDQLLITLRWLGG